MLIALTIWDRGAQYLADVVKTAIRVNHGSSSPMAITDRSTAYPKMLMRSAIALASVRPQEAINDRIHPPPHGEPRCSKQTNESPIFVLVKKKEYIGWRDQGSHSLLLRSGIALACARPLAISDRPQRSPSVMAISDGREFWLSSRRHHWLIPRPHHWLIPHPHHLLTPSGVPMEAYLQRRSLDFDFNAVGDFEDKFLKIVNADAVADELASAIAWVMENVSKTPVGAECPLRKTTDIKALLEKGTKGVLSAGSLSALSLSATAVSTTDTGRRSSIFYYYYWFLLL